jgi:hypothetical protein
MSSLMRRFKIGSSKPDDTSSTDRIVEGNEPSTSKKAGGALRWLVGDAQKRIAKDQDIVRNDLPVITERIRTTIEKAQTIQRDKTYDVTSITSLIELTDGVKAWINNYQKALGLTKEEYEQISKGYLGARRVSKKYPDSVRLRENLLAEAMAFLERVETIPLIRTGEKNRIGKDIEELHELNTKCEQSLDDYCDKYGSLKYTMTESQRRRIEEISGLDISNTDFIRIYGHGKKLNIFVARGKLEEFDTIPLEEVRKARRSIKASVEEFRGYVGALSTLERHLDHENPPNQPSME